MIGVLGFMPKVKDTKTKENKQRNGKLSLYPLQLKEAVEDLLMVKPKENSKKENQEKEDRI
jgi:hypothetical protein